MPVIPLSQPNLEVALRPILRYFVHPVLVLSRYERRNLQPDLLAGVTGAMTLLPQAIAFSLIAELPPQMGLYGAIVGAIIGALWGSSNQTLTAPTNTTSLLVLSALLTVAQPDSPDFLVAAGLLAVMVGIFQLLMGLIRAGALVNFVSHSVIVGFASGAAVLIAIQQLPHFLGEDFQSHSPLETLQGVVTHLPAAHGPTVAIGLGTIITVTLLRRVKPGLPATPLALVIASAVVFLLKLDRAGVGVLGQLPRGLPPLANVPLRLDFIARLSTSALTLGAIGLVQAAAVGRSLASQTGQRLDSNQEFVGQGLANIAVGLFSGYPCAGSFSASAVNFKNGAKTPVAAVTTGVLVLIALSILAPLAAYLPRAALSGVLLLTAYGMIDWPEIARIGKGAHADALIMVVTLLSTVFLKLEFAVLAGILLSFTLYILRTAMPQVYPVLPNEKFTHLVAQAPGAPGCPQLGLIKISGDLYFGAVNNVEEKLLNYLADHPHHRFLLLRMQGVNNCDINGIFMLETIRATCLRRGGDLYLMKVQQPVRALMQSTGFYQQLGEDHFLPEDAAISHLFYHVLNPAICIYECEARAFLECQNLPKRIRLQNIPAPSDIPAGSVAAISRRALRSQLQELGNRPVVIDVRQPREFQRGHIPGARPIPLPDLPFHLVDLPRDCPITFVCQSGQRSQRAAHLLKRNGWINVTFLQGGLLAWQAAGFFEVTG
jgi:SulP family sulfate permease